MEEIKVGEEADKMFENLGYEKKYQIYEDKVVIIAYTKENAMVEECEIMFLKLAKKLLVNVWIGMQELQAINQKCKELNWLNE